MPEYKLLGAGDLHKLHKDISTIKGYRDCTIAVQRKLMSELIKNKITHFLCLSDWYHKGYSSDVAAGLSDVDMDIEMSHIVNGNFYGVLGNHVRLNMDSNPELHLIQPHPELKSRIPVTRKEQVMRTPNYIIINGVQISFMHYLINSKDVLDYKPFRQPDVKYHIALFHTPLIVPNAQLAKTNYSYNASSNTRIGKTLEGVDYALVGDIHNPLGQFTINTEKGPCVMCVPGSLTNTDAGKAGRHTSVNLPIITISEEGTVKIEYLYFDILTNLLTFKDLNEDDNTKLKSTQGNPVESLYSDKSTSSLSIMRGGEDGFLSLTDFITEQNYTASDKGLIRCVLDNPSNLDEIVRTYRER